MSKDTLYDFHECSEHGPWTSISGTPPSGCPICGAGRVSAGREPTDAALRDVEEVLTRMGLAGEWPRVHVRATASMIVAALSGTALPRGAICPTHGKAVLVTHVDDAEPCSDYLSRAAVPGDAQAMLDRMAASWGLEPGAGPFTEELLTQYHIEMVKQHNEIVAAVPSERLMIKANCQHCHRTTIVGFLDELAARYDRGLEADAELRAASDDDLPPSHSHGREVWVNGRYAGKAISSDDALAIARAVSEAVCNAAVAGGPEREEKGQ